MAAGEDQPQAIVADGALLGLGTMRLGVEPGELGEPGGALGAGPLAA